MFLLLCFEVEHFSEKQFFELKTFISPKIINIILVNVKWGKEKFEGVELNTDESPEVFQAQLFALSGVPPERQKVMAKGKSLKVSYYFYNYIQQLFFLEDLQYNVTLIIFTT